MSARPSFLSAGLTVPIYELDARGRLSATALANYLFEAASRHASALGLGVEHLAESNLTWMISRLRVEIERPARWGEALEVTTWPSGVEPPYTWRDFEVRGTPADPPLARALSSWMLIDLQTRRPARPPEAVRAMPFPERERALPGGFARLPRPERPELERAFTVRYGDLDSNRHANFVSYLGWIVESVPAGVLEGSELAAVEVSYRAESTLGDPIAVQSQAESEDGVFLHRVVRPADGRELALARTRWRPDAGSPPPDLR